MTANGKNISTDESNSRLYRKKESRMPESEVEQFKFWNIKQASDFCGSGTKYIYNLIHNGSIPAVRIGNAFMIPSQAFVKFLEDQAAENLIKR